MNKLVFQSFVVALVMLSCMSSMASARDWKNSHSGYWYDLDCDFNGHDISCMNNLSMGECAQRCVAHGDCTHFTQREGDNFCCIKNHRSGFLEINHPGHRCGFIPGRSDQSTGNKKK